ncbi:MAG: HD domain-containing protein [Lachnospiraceae bacterium]|nr:HD domain-containing protein [Lachnospiraceae bacterium]
MFTKDRNLISPAQKGKYSSIKGLYSILPISTRGHMERVSEYGDSFYRYLRQTDAELIYREFGKEFPLYSKEVFCYHDIGRSFIPVSILNKVEKLTDEEMRIIKNHTTYAIQAIESIYQNPFPDEIMMTLFKISLYHHERYDGRGYPENLEGENIPFCARVCALVDTLDGITSWKPYRASQISKKVAVEIMERDRGSQFDPWLYDRFKEWIVMSENEET